MGACYVRPDSGIQVGRIVLRVLREMEWSQKQAAITAGIDEPAFSRGIAGLGPIDLHALIGLPASFWWKFFRETIKAVLLREEVEHEQERKRA